jgi:hypothetical protein
MVMQLRTKLLFSLIIFSFAFLRLLGLGTDLSNSDALRWHRRSENFLSALKTFNFADTYQHYQPGVTLMWLNALTKQNIFWVSRLFFGGAISLNNADWFSLVDGISKSVLVLVLAVLFSWQLYYISRLHGHKTAMFFGALVAVEPYLIGIDRWFHLTSLESYLCFLTFLAFVYSIQNRKKKDLILSAIFLALAVLTKTTSLIMLPILSVLVFLNYKTINKKDILDFVFVFFVAVFLLFPALWVNPIETLRALVSAIIGAQANSIRQEILPINDFLYYPLILTAKMTIVTFGLLCFSFIFNIRNKSSRYVYVYLLTFLLFLTLVGQKIDRYTISLFLPSLLLVAQMLSHLSTKKAVVLSALSCALAIMCYIHYYPVLSAYYSPLMGQTKGALRLGIYDNSGEYFAQAAFWLNTKGRDTSVYVPNNVESFSPYFKGKISLTGAADYEVYSLDMGRVSLEKTMCKKVVKFFGPQDRPIVYILECR